MAELTLTAPSKLNLLLRVGPPGGDGYHPVRSLMVALDQPHDTVRVARGSRRLVDCPMAPGPENLAWTALDALEAHVGRSLPVEVSIAKTIPAQAGLGGGSSDAATALKAANALHSCGLSDAALERVAAQVGSDVAFFVKGGAQWAEGRGERLRPALVPKDLHVVVVDSGVELPTGAVYAAHDRAAPRGLDSGAQEIGVNDLWPAALGLRPRLGRVARDLRVAGADRTLLCGSGGAVAGLFVTRHAAEAAAEELSPAYRAWVAGPDTGQAEAPCEG
jgi:4-diphosphocytidyl-2-C-methyl-D-erythritol kinase